MGLHTSSLKGAVICDIHGERCKAGRKGKIYILFLVGWEFVHRDRDTLNGSKSCHFVTPFFSFGLWKAQTML